MIEFGDIKSDMLDAVEANIPAVTEPLGNVVKSVQNLAKILESIAD